MGTRTARTVGRRDLIIGAGTVLGATTLTGTVAAAAGADEALPQGSAAGSPAPPDAGALGSPVASTIASAPLNGFTYRHVSMFDFTPEGPTSQRAWGGFGVYTTNSTSTLWASVEIPAGALIRDIEWYVRNTSGANVNALGRLWAAGTGTLEAVVRDISVPPAPNVIAVRGAVPSTAYGPYPLGTRLTLGLTTPTTGTVQVNGARVGFTGGAGDTGLLNTPIRIYDSRVTGGKFGSGATRTITFPTSVVRPGTSGVIVNVATTGAVGNGYLKVYANGAAVPDAAALNYGTANAVANALPVAISAGRQIRIFASHSVHVIVDMLGRLG